MWKHKHCHHHVLYIKVILFLALLYLQLPTTHQLVNRVDMRMFYNLVKLVQYIDLWTNYRKAPSTEAACGIEWCSAGFTEQTQIEVKSLWLQITKALLFSIITRVETKEIFMLLNVKLSTFSLMNSFISATYIEITHTVKYNLWQKFSSNYKSYFVSKLQSQPRAYSFWTGLIQRNRCSPNMSN